MNQTASRRNAARKGGLFLSASQCARLRAGFGKCARAVLRDMLEDADREAPARRERAIDRAQS